MKSQPNTSKNDRFNVGDGAWVARCGVTQVRRPCPVCFGKRFVTVILGDDSLIDTPCDYCGKGYEGPRGYEMVYEYVAQPVLETVIEVKRTASIDGESFEYRTTGGYYTGRLYSSLQEAQDVAEREAKKQAEEQDGRLRSIKEHDTKSYAWHVGYHLREAKVHRRKLEYHEARVQPCKDAARIERAAKRKAAANAS